jgi:ribosomal protein S3
MGQKTNPIALRINLNRTFDSPFFLDKNSNYPQLLQKDFQIRHFLKSLFLANSLQTGRILVQYFPKKLIIHFFYLGSSKTIGRGSFRKSGGTLVAPTGRTINLKSLRSSGRSLRLNTDPLQSRETSDQSQSGSVKQNNIFKNNAVRYDLVDMLASRVPLKEPTYLTKQQRQTGDQPFHGSLDNFNQLKLFNFFFFEFMNSRSQSVISRPSGRSLHTGPCDRFAMLPGHERKGINTAFKQILTATQFVNGSLNTTPKRLIESQSAPSNDLFALKRPNRWSDSSFEGSAAYIYNWVASRPSPKAIVNTIPTGLVEPLVTRPQGREAGRMLRPLVARPQGREAARLLRPLVALKLRPRNPGHTIIGRSLVGSQKSFAASDQLEVSNHLESILQHVTQCETHFIPYKFSSYINNANFICGYIIDRLQQSIPFRQIFKHILIELKKSKKIKGIRVVCSGRLGGVEMARIESKKYGQTSLHVFSSKIDFAANHAYTLYGLIGVKVWLSVRNSH